MDFALDEDQKSIDELVGKMLAELVTDDEIKKLERDGRWMHERAWSELANAALLGLSLPEEAGGSGFTVVELCNVARHCGRVVAPIPFVPATFGAAWALAHYGGSEQAALLAGLLGGEAIVTVAIEEPTNRNLLLPTLTATADDKLIGTKTSVVAGMTASHAIVTATGPDGPSLFVVALDGPGVERESQLATDGTPMAMVSFDGARATALGGGANGVSDLVNRLRLGYAAEALGVCDRAIEITAEYTRTRKQFHVPIGTFQAVKQRIADAYIQRAALEVSVLRAAWLVANGRDADEEVNIAGWWACEAGHGVTTAAQHLHGGMGFDRDYPIHRYFLRAKRLEFTLGSAPEHLAELGDIFAEKDGTP